jgi:hypothetical protein
MVDMVFRHLLEVSPEILAVLFVVPVPQRFVEASDLFVKVHAHNKFSSYNGAVGFAKTPPVATAPPEELFLTNHAKDAVTVRRHR